MPDFSDASLSTIAVQTADKDTLLLLTITSIVRCGRSWFVNTICLKVLLMQRTLLLL